MPVRPHSAPFPWDRTLLWFCAAFHFIAALVLLLAPYDLLLTEGTRPALDLLSRYTWAGIYFACGLACVCLCRWRHWAVQLTSAVMIAATGGIWFTALLLAVQRGTGSALGVVVWPFLYAPWGIVAVRLGLRRVR